MNQPNTVGETPRQQRFADMRRVSSQPQTLVVSDDSEIEILPVLTTETPPTKVYSSACAVQSEQTPSSNGIDDVAETADVIGVVQLARKLSAFDEDDFAAYFMNMKMNHIRYCRATCYDNLRAEHVRSIASWLGFFK